MRSHTNILAALFFCTLSLTSQNLEKGKNYYLSGIGFYNVENLYDTINDPVTIDEEFLPTGDRLWTGDRYWTKIDHLSRVISEMASDVTPDGLAIVGLCEIENGNVLKDLVAAPKLKPRNYQIVHFDGPDARGVDPALLYNPKYFKLTKAVTYKVVVVTDSAHKTREQLVVSGLFLGEPFSFIVNHWPSRRGSESASRPNRISAAKVCRRIVDSIAKADPNSKIVVMGDLNDDPNNESVKKYLNTYGDINQKYSDKLYNTMEPLFKKGIGSLAWADAWNLFDQIIINKLLIPTDYKTFQFYRAFVFNKPYLKEDFGNFKGYTFRTYSGATYTGGYSDHFPTYILIVKEKN
jgi:hypothetical protein